MQFLHLSIKFISERFYASVMHSKKNVFLLCRYSNIRFELYLLTEAYTCNKNRLLQKHIQKLLPILLSLQVTLLVRVWKVILIHFQFLLPKLIQPFVLFFPPSVSSYTHSLYLQLSNSNLILLPSK